ncbi:MAG: hypothetical protein C0624_14515 [Desulfuromonas sp.]|nr:MAG: hypothetical protein C0624_14515 [Desulfuromonas sp.]
MKKWPNFICSVFCFMNIAMPGNVLATNLDEPFESNEDQSEQRSQEDKGHMLTFMTENSGLHPVSAHTETPINTLHLYLADASGSIVKDAQLITTLIDQNGHQQANRATPYKCGYFVAIDQLPAGPYRVETEIVTTGQLWTDEFTFNKA